MRVRPLLAVLFLLLFAGTSHATSIRGFTLPQLHEEADVIAVGQITGQHAFWNDAHDTIYTHYDITVTQTVKGAKRTTLTLRLMGGQVDDVRLSISGNPELQVGERVLIAARDQGEFVTLVGMAQGKWTVRALNGMDHAYRGRAATEGSAQREGEIPLKSLIEQLNSRQGGKNQ